MSRLWGLAVCELCYTVWELSRTSCWLIGPASADHVTCLCLAQRAGHMCAIYIEAMPWLVPNAQLFCTECSV